jgi:hypothetical protein
VMVLDKGVCIYFGPAATAKRYFEDLGFECEKRKSMPYYFCSIIFVILFLLYYFCYLFLLFIFVIYFCYLFILVIYFCAFSPVQFLSNFFIFFLATPDFLTGITNPLERKVRQGCEDTVPVTAADMERRYLTSEVREQMEAEAKEYESFIEKSVKPPFPLYLFFN